MEYENIQSSLYSLLVIKYFFTVFHLVVYFLKNSHRTKNKPQEAWVYPNHRKQRWNQVERHKDSALEIIFHVFPPNYKGSTPSIMWSPRSRTTELQDRCGSSRSLAAKHRTPSADSVRKAGTTCSFPHAAVSYLRSELTHSLMDGETSQGWPFV